MKFVYNGMTFSGSRTEIIKEITDYLERLDMTGCGEFEIGREKGEFNGNVSNIKRQLISKVQVPYEYDGKIWTLKQLRAALGELDAKVLIQLVDVKELIIDRVIEDVKRDNL